jgi:DNA-binding transcriptional MerR regulator
VARSVRSASNPPRVPAGPDDPAAEKAPNAYRTISEVSTDLEVPQHVLRFWETRFSQLRPMKRGGGRRYYRPEDIELLRKIRGWLYQEGLTIRGVQRRLRGRGSKQALTLPDEGAEATPLTPEQHNEVEAVLEVLYSIRAELDAPPQPGKPRRR